MVLASQVSRRESEIVLGIMGSVLLIIFQIK